MVDVELGEQRVEFALARALVGLDDFEDGPDVVFDRQAAEDRGFLRQVADSEARAAVHRHPGDVVAVEQDVAAVGRHEAGDHVEAGGLARAVGAEEADRLAAAHVRRRRRTTTLRPR